MYSLQDLQSGVNRFDVAAIKAADERIDAEKGRALMAAMDARHFEQGALAAQMGLSPASLWSQAHITGYNAFKSGASITFNLGGVPAMLREILA